MSQNAGYTRTQRVEAEHRPAAAGLRAWTLAMSFLLLADFLFGMAVNLFIRLPAGHPGTHASGYFTGAGRALWWAMTQGEVWIAVHTAVSLAMIAMAIVFVILALINGRNGQDARWLWVSGLGALFMIGAGFGGATFLENGDAASSMTMALGFALSLASYLAGLYLPVPPAGRRR